MKTKTRQNITLSLDRETIRKARVIAAMRGVSVSRLLGEELRRMVDEEEFYEHARRQALHELEKGFHLGGTPAGRDDLHER